MSKTSEVTADTSYDWWAYTKIGVLLAVIVAGLIAMFTTSTTPPAQTISAMQAAMQNGVAVPGVAAADLPAWWLLLLTGFMIGCYGTIVGIGGGPIILPLLVFFYGWENELLLTTIPDNIFT